LKGKTVAAHQDEIFKAMADPNRRRILGELCRQSREAGELARMVGLAPNALSFHLRALKSADLVSVRREGRYLRYSLEADRLESWRRQIDQLFPLASSRAGSFAASHAIEPDESESSVEPQTNSDQLPTELL